jgi:hypothetical protein
MYHHTKLPGRLQKNWTRDETNYIKSPYFLAQDPPLDFWIVYLAADVGKGEVASSDRKRSSEHTKALKTHAL